MMALNLEEWRLFIRDHLPTALVVGFATSGATYLVVDTFCEKQIRLADARLQIKKDESDELDKLRATVKDLRKDNEHYLEQDRRRRDVILAAGAGFDPARLDYRDSRNVKVVEIKSEKK